MKQKIKIIFNRESYFFKTAPAFVWQLLFFLIPIAFLLALSFIQSDSNSWWGYSLTMAHYEQLLSFDYVKIIIRSFFMALITALLCLFVGYPLTYYIALKKRAWKNIFLFFLVLPFVTNLLVLTYAWNFVLDKDGLLNQLLLFLHLIAEPLPLLNNYFAILLVMFYCYLPFMIMPLFASLEKFDRTLIEASHDLGATQTQTFFKIILPMTWPAIQTGMLLVFIPAFGEFVIPLLMGGDKYMFVGSVISHYFFVGQDRPVGAAFTLLVSVLMCAFIVFYLFFFSSKRPKRRGQAYDKIS